MKDAVSIDSGWEVRGNKYKIKSKKYEVWGRASLRNQLGNDFCVFILSIFAFPKCS